MDVIFEVELHHIEKAAEAILAARMIGDNERLAVEESMPIRLTPKRAFAMCETTHTAK